MPSHYGAAALLCALAATPIALVQLPHPTKPTVPVDVRKVEAAPKAAVAVVQTLGHMEPQSQLLDWWDRDAPSRQLPGEARPDWWIVAQVAKRIGSGKPLS